MSFQRCFRQGACWGAGSLTGHWCCEGDAGSEPMEAEQLQHRAANGLGFLQSLLQQVADQPFAVGTVLEPSECCNVWPDITSQLQVNIHLFSFFLPFCKELLTFRSPAHTFVRHASPTPTSQWSLPSQMSVSLSLYRAVRGRCDTALHAKR